MTETKDIAGEETKTYELGLLVTPLLTEEGVVAFLDGVMKQVFVRLGIKVASTDTSKMMPLAYTIRKRIDNKNQVFREAYFVSIRFSAMPEAIPELTAGLRKMSEVIRSLVIIIPQVTEAAQDRRPVSEVKPIVEVPVIVSKTDQKAVIDQEIENLILN
jgi:ribosomal protein S6